MTRERPAEVGASRSSIGSRAVRRMCQAGARVLGAAAATALCLAAAAMLFAIMLFSAGCAFTERIVDRKLLSSPEMRFDYLDRDRDIADITGTVAGGGGGGNGGC